MSYNAKTNWQVDDTVMPADMIRIEQGIKTLDLEKLSKTAIILYSGNDLNDQTEIGVYTWLGSASQKIINSPEAVECTMLVLPRLMNYDSNNSIQNRTQIIFTSTNRFYIRQLINNVWGNWSDGMENFWGIKKYNIPNFSVEEAGELTLYTNPIPNTWTFVPRTAGTYINGIYTITVSQFTTDAPTLNAFDENPDTYWQGSNTNPWIMIDFGSLINIKKVKIKLEATGDAANGFKIQGSNNPEDDTASWTDLYTDGSNHILPELKEIILSNPGKYRYYRIWFSNLDISSSGQKTCRLYVFEPVEYLVDAKKVNYVLPNLLLNHWTSGQILLLEIPTENFPGIISSNSLSNLPIDMVLQAGKRYELVYQVSKFQAKEVV